jgi:hypothetical protein
VPRLDATPVLVGIGANDLHRNYRGAGLRGDSAPSFARHRQWIHGISRNDVTEAEVIGGNRVGDAVTCLADILAARASPELVLDRVDAHKNRPKPFGHLPRQRALSATGQPPEHDQHGHRTGLRQRCNSRQ